MALLKGKSPHFVCIGQPLVSMFKCGSVNTLYTYYGQKQYIHVFHFKKTPKYGLDQTPELQFQTKNILVCTSLFLNTMEYPLKQAVDL